MQNKNKYTKQLCTITNNTHISNMYVYSTINEKYQILTNAII